MPLRKALVAITIGRGESITKTRAGGEIARPKEKIRVLPGQTFDFTDDEIEEIEAVQPDAFSNKGEIDLETGEVTSAEVKSKTTGKKAEKSTGKTTSADDI